MTSRLQGIISDLDASLATTVRNTGDPKNQNSPQFLSINTVNDEFNYWSEQTLGSKNKAERERASFFRDALQPLKADFDKITVEAVSALLETVEKAHDVLDDIWRQQEHVVYPKVRMVHLLDVISEQIIGVIQSKLGDRNIMTAPISSVKEDLICSTDALDAWINIIKTLTGTFWPVCPQNRWEGEPFNNVILSNISERIKKILALKRSYHSLLSLLDPEEQKELHVEEALSAFAVFNPFECNSYVEEAWKNAMTQYNRSIEHVEVECAQKLQTIFASLQGQPNQLLREFQRFKDLVQRETISRSLTSERETLLAQLTSSLKAIKGEFRERVKDGNNSRGKNLPIVVSNIVWTRQAIVKIEETDDTVISLVGPKSNYQALSSEVFEELRKYEQEQFEDWSKTTLDSLDDADGNLTINHNDRLMELDFNSGKLVVNYGDHLVTLLREVRQLLSMGFPVPAKIQQAADNAIKYYRHGIILKQVAHFYNTIDQEMLPCQQSMLLESALSFERLIKEPKGAPSGTKNSAITWDSPAQLEEYITKLQTAADTLTSQNRKLRKFHDIIKDHVSNLMNIDLVKNQSRWKDILSQIRGIINTVQDSGVKAELTLTWRNHWDYQLYKALQYQYQVGLENLNETLPEIKVDLCFKQQKLQFRPPFEEVRAKYYRELKKFINLPTVFKGLGENRIFTMLVDQNSSSLSTVYSKAETLFQNLAKITDSFKDWVVLGTVNLDTFVQDALSEVGDWEVNFRMLKQKGKEAEHLPSSIKVDCITVSITPVKATIDDHLQHLFDAMLVALRRAIAVHYSEIDEFVSKGMEVLSNRPKSMEDIGEANKKHEELSKSKIAIQKHFDAAEIKNKLLKSVAGSGVDATTPQAKWNKLELMLESHELMIKEQVDGLRGAIDGRIRVFMTDLEKFTARWHQLKPKASELGSLDNALSSITFIKERIAEFGEIEKTAAEIVVDSGHFGVSPPEFTELEIVRDDLKRSETMWSICEEYVEGLSSLKKEDWVSFRSKAFQFDEFISKWTERIRSQPIDAMVNHILKDLDKYRNHATNIKFLRGDNWTGEHWGELFRLVSIPKGVTLSDLTFGHFLEAYEAVASKINEIKELNSRANGEIAIREAIQELEIWAANSTFTLTDYQDAKGGKLQLIRDWKETLTQVGDNQSLLSSLKDSPYFKSFADKSAVWEQKLGELDEYLRQLNIVQRRWVYLEPIFSRGALPAEQSRFARIDEDFQAIISSIMRDSRIISIISYPSIRSILVALVDQLERCQKALNEFLEQKRAKFARFYFLGDDDLLEILGQSKNPQVIQVHLKKLFAGVHYVKFSKDASCIVAMRSITGEEVPLKTPVQVTDQVEVWLHNFALEMKSTLKQQLLECVKTTDIFKYPSQMIGLAEYLHFTRNVERVITSGDFNGFNQLSEQLQGDLEKYTTFDTAAIPDKTERSVIELKIKSLILDIIHFLDVVNQLKVAKPASLSDWAWKRQLRFYLNQTQTCMICMNDAQFEYTYEYQGNPPKLVHTPLTDKCYLTLTQAMASGFGGNPFGPAGTGKTESVKALGVLFGRQVLVFNCDEGIDYKSMGRIFVGLVKCGAWGCFDEFNRLEEAVLSAVSQQIQFIQASLKAKENNVTLLGKTVDLDPNSGIFVTLNPAGKGYGGRQKLPDNLKQLFRSVAMTHPNNELISEVILYSEGFHSAKELGRKVVSVFTLCKQFLTPQQHYDWGLRAVKSVLRQAGKLKRADPQIQEDPLLMRALRDFNMPKIVTDDKMIFLKLIGDLFPGIEVKSK